MAIRVQGRQAIAQLQQGGPAPPDLRPQRTTTVEDLFAVYKLLDLGDHIGVRGYLMRTRTGRAHRPR